MTILQLTNRIPYPLNDGGNIGVMYYTKGFLDAGIRLSMLAMNTSRHYIDPESLPEIFDRLEHFVTVPVNNDIRPLDALKNLIKGKSYNIQRFISPEVKQALIQLLKQNNFDIVQLEGLYLTAYIPIIRQYSKAKISIRQHNVEFRIWERLAAGNRGLKKWYLTQLAKQLKQYELQHLNDYDLILAISKQEEMTFKELGARIPIMVHPFGIAVKKIPFQPSWQPPLSVYHIGAMDWLPNQQSVNWLLEKVWPQVVKVVPEARLFLAGRNMPPFYRQRKWPQVEVVGEVPDAASFESDKSILVVPLLSGGGVRIKIFQGMAMGKAVVTTTIGLEGIEAEGGKEVLVADQAGDFAQEIIYLLQHPDKIKQIGTAARELMNTYYDQEKLIAKLLKTYSQILLDS